MKTAVHAPPLPVGVIDRIDIRSKPPGWPLGYQRWEDALFLHWPLAPTVARTLVPEPLEIDVAEGSAWVSIVAFRSPWARAPLVPALPPLTTLTRSLGLNVRIYVHYAGVPGLWFLSLDTDSAVATLGGRLGFSVPYFRAAMEASSEGDAFRFRSVRREDDSPATFEARWTAGGSLGEAKVGSLEFFLVERYCLYTVRGEELRRGRVFHPPWTLREASLAALDSTMLERNGIPTPEERPLVHVQDVPFEAGIWPLAAAT